MTRLPPGGPAHRFTTYSYDDIRGLPVHASELRLHVGSDVGPAARLQATAGAGWLWGKDIPVLILGGGGRFGGGRTQLVIDIERWHFGIPYELVEYLYSEVLAFSSRQVLGEERNWHRPFLIRIGFERDGF